MSYCCIKLFSIQQINLVFFRIIDSLNEATQLEMKLIEKNAMPIMKEGQLKQRTCRDLSVNIQPQIALRILTEPYFATYPELLPVQGRLEPRDAKRLSFFKSEDNLLALGVEQFGKKFDLISTYLMPAATPMQLKTRFKNLLSKREYVNNPVVLFKRTNRLPPLESGLCIKLPRGKVITYAASPKRDVFIRNLGTPTILETRIYCNTKITKKPKSEDMSFSCQIKND